MSKVPFFSIIIPTYNSEATLSRALDSIVSQTFQNYEILIIDGLSSDNTKSLVEAYRINHSYIRWFSQKDNGIYDAMNNGIINSRGKWLYFIGSDDFLFDNHVLFNVLSHIEDKVQGVYGNVFSAIHNSLYDGKFTYEKLRHKNICHQAIFFKKVVFEKVGNFDVSYRVLGDWHHNIRWFYNDDIPIQFIDLTIAQYSDGGYSSLHRDEKFSATKNQLFLKYGFFKLPLSSLIAITTKIVKKNKNQNSYFYLLIYGMLLFGLKTKKQVADALNIKA
jgi:glycosyltransferase involved in cell wall biosynthesis